MTKKPKVTSTRLESVNFPKRKPVKESEKVSEDVDDTLDILKIFNL